MGRGRKHDKGLPKRVYLRRGVYYYVRPTDGKWVPIGKTEPDMLRALASIREKGNNALAEIFTRYAQEILPKKAPKTARDQLHQLSRLRETFNEFTRPEQIQTQHVAQYLDAHSSATMANREIALLSHIYKKAIRWGMASHNPCHLVERNKEHKRKHYVDHYDFWLAWTYAKPHIRLAMELAYLTGQRQADVLNLRLSDVRSDGLYVCQGKTGTELISGWTPRLRQLVQEARQRTVGSVWLIADDKGQRYTLAAVRTAWTRLMAICPCERFQFRDIRKKSANDHETGRHLGHKEAGTLGSVYRIKPAVITGVK